MVSQTRNFYSQTLIITHEQCKCNQPQLGQSTNWANYIMIIKTTPSRNVYCIWKRIIMFQIISLMMDINYSSMVFQWGVKSGDKPIPVMMILDPKPQAIIEVVSCECKTNCCIGGVNAIKYNCITHSPAKRESIAIHNTADVSEFWKWLNH